MLLEAVSIVLLLVASGFFSGSETALFALTDLELREMESGSRSQRRAVGLVRQPERTLVTVLLANMVINVLISVIVASMALRAFGSRGLVIAIPVATVSLLLFGEIVPKFLGLRRRKLIAPVAAPILSFLAVVLGPAQIALEWMARKVVGRGGSAPLTREELPTLVDVVREAGALSPFEARVMRRVLRFADTQVGRCMTPRTEMVTLDAGSTVGAALALFESSGRSRIPVWEGGPEDVVGVVLQKDLMTDPELSAEDPLRSRVREVAHVPETVPAAVLFRQFQRDRVHLAIVVGEHGGVEGLVTLEDLLEEIVGDIRDESDAGVSALEPMGDGSWRGSASLELVDVAEILGLDLGTIEESVTISGVLQHELGRVPRRGDEVDWSGWRIRVLTASPTRARLVRLFPVEGEER